MKLRMIVSVLCGISLILAPTPLTDSAGAVSNGTCHDTYIPVALAPGQPVDQQVFARVCTPTGSTPTAVQVLVHGCLYNGQYWDFPDPTAGTNRYSYTDAALDAGYATVAFDMIGNGRSSKPNSSRLTFDAGVYVIHQVIQAMRAGTVTGPTGDVAYSKVIEVSHSFGTFFAWKEVSTYNDVDAVIFTGATHHLSVSTPLLGAFLSLYPATLDPQFFSVLDAGYLTTLPNTRKQTFYDPATVDPAVIAYDEAHKDLLTLAEFIAFPAVIATPLDIRVPVFTVMGQSDPLFCSPLATNCSSGAALAAQEAPSFGPNVPSVDGYVLPNAGHNLNLMLNAGDWFNAAQTWALSKVTP